MLIRKPIKHHLQAVHKWLTTEKEEQGHSFICNWSVIRAAFDEHRMMVETERDGVASFFTWSYGRRVTEGLVVVTAPALRGHGVGARMMEAAHSRLHDEGIWLIYVDCVPSPSEAFWRKQGYIDYPNGYPQLNDSSVKLYRSLRSAQGPEQHGRRVELWFRDTFGRTPDAPPDAAFAADSDLAFPVDPDWHARVVDPVGTTKEDKIKRLVKSGAIEGRYLVASSTEWVV